MKKPFTPLAILAALALALPSAAAAEYLIPDGNSAVNQYTEGIPTGGGEKDTEGSGQDEVEPGKALGAKNAKKLESKGPEGQAAAELAAETAPPTVVADEAGDGKGKQGNESTPNDGGESEANGGAPAATDSGPGGSSGVGELVSAATGGSDGGIGLLLPLTIFAAAIWGVVYAFLRRRDHTPEPLPHP